MVYSNPQAVDAPDILGSVFDFVKEFGLPTFSEANIFRGYQNVPLPKDSNEMCIYNLVATVRNGTNNKGIISNELMRTTQMYNIGSAQIDFYSNDDFMALQRATQFCLISRDNIGISFFSTYNIALLYSSDPKNLSYMDESGQYVKRFGLELKLGYYINQKINVQCFEKAKVTSLNNTNTYKP